MNEACPFCGSTHLESWDQPGIAWVACRDCGTEGPIHTTETEAVAAWNRRAPAPKDLGMKAEAEGAGA